jgi:hypothetical protein
VSPTVVPAQLEELVATLGADPGYVLEEDRALLGTAAAVFSADRIYRFLLIRTWDPALPLLAWVMLNPSTGGARTSDPTLTRCANFTRRFRFGGMVIANLYALRSAHPRALTNHPCPAGPRNDAFIAAAVAAAGLTVAAWGQHGRLVAARAAEVTGALTAARTPLRCLGRTRDGSPRHPVRLAASAALQPFGSAETSPPEWTAGRAGELVTGPACRLTNGSRAGDNAVLIGLSGPSSPFSGAAISPRNADGPH